MDEWYDNKVSVELNAEVDRLLEREEELVTLFQKRVEEFSKVVRFMKGYREKLCNKIETLSYNRLKTFERIREKLKIIRLNEKRREILLARLREMEKRELTIKDEYNSILSGMKQCSEGRESLVAPYKANRRLDSRSPRSSRGELIRRKEDFFEVLKRSFERLEAEFFNIEKQKKGLNERLKEVSYKIYKADKEHAELQREYTEQIKEMKRLKRSIKKVCMDERTIISDYDRFLSDIRSIIEVPEEIRSRLLPVLSRIEEENDPEEKEWVVEVEKLPSSGGKLIEFPRG